MRPTIRYCATPAGRVAYSASGSGPALLCDSGWISENSADIYDRVYASERPELFFKSAAWRVSGPGAPVSVRADSSIDVPEPELRRIGEPGAERPALRAAPVTDTGIIGARTSCLACSGRIA